jgi:hypothetical protein
MPHIYPRILYATLLFSLVTASCSSQNDLLNQGSSVINWENLQIASKTNDDLCAEISPDEIDDWENIKRDFTSGLAVGFIPEDLSIPRKIAHETYWVNSNEQLSFDWLFWYPDGNKTSATLRLFALLDERQLEGALPESGFYNDINLERGTDLSIKVKIPPLEPGVHDFIVVAIPYPENDPNVYGTTVVVYRRITLIARPVPAPFRDTSFTSLIAEGSIKNGDPMISLELTLKDNGTDVWNWPDPWLYIHTDTPTHFHALAGHEDVTNIDIPLLEPLEESFFAILLFIDYQQIEVSPNRLAFYNKVDKDNAYGQITLKVPSLSKGKHRILVLRIDTPGVPVCLLNGNPKGRILPNSIYGKLVGLVVLPPK